MHSCLIISLVKHHGILAKRIFQEVPESWFVSDSEFTLIVRSLKNVDPEHMQFVYDSLRSFLEQREGLGNFFEGFENGIQKFAVHRGRVVYGYEATVSTNPVITISLKKSSTVARNGN